jgi:hypothetical protein
MKRIILILAAATALTGCVVTDPYYIQPQPVYVQPRPVYIPPPVYYRPPPPPPPRCYWVQRWDPQYRVNRNVRICR